MANGEAAELDDPTKETGADDQETPEEGKSLLKLAIILVISLLIIAAIVAIVFLVFFSSQEELGLLVSSPEDAKFAKQYNLRRQTEIIRESLPVWTDPHIHRVNLKGGKNIVHLAWRAKLYDANAVLYLVSRSPMVDTKLVLLLQGKSVKELRNRAGIDLLKADILREINSVFPQEFIEKSQTKDRTPVKEILIKEYFIQ